jgi:hypothetical protein
MERNRRRVRRKEMAIKGLTEVKRMPRQGKIRLGIKKVSPRTKGEYPVATDYFVCPQEVQKVYGEKPRKLDVIIPVEDDETWASQFYRQYSKSRGLVCKGDGETCRRMVDVKTGTIAGRDTKEITWVEGAECKGRECPDYLNNACQEVMNLQFLLPKIPGLGVWQIDTGSIHSIMNINNCATMIRAMCGRVNWIPLTLSLEPTEVNNPEDGKKKTVYCMHLRYERSAESLLLDSEKPRLQVLLAAPSDDEAPEDRQLTAYTPEKHEELHSKVQDDIEELWPGGDGKQAAIVTDTKPTLGDALNWCLKEHHKDKKWFIDNCGFKEQELLDEPVKVESAIQNICAFTGWKFEMPKKGGEK